ncbi:Crp/Fnr family transcriptional regulator [Aliikangiella coralliicola]|uniref:Crp/Fnr family transcriptional regulator n=2 Tax=Aliikangiella coralliicola TaxID=2592383 RepID=A0A545UCN0_9GAMM|nr:Crp/Fnr family transcriptional regulator [Aliikangiella coralliicola]
MDSYFPISDETWQGMKNICQFSEIEKDAILYRVGELPQSFSFVYSGLFRLFVVDDKGHEYNKIFFDERTFPGSMTALLTSSPSQYTIESLEPSVIITINFKGFRKLLLEQDDLKLFHINYLEKNWLLAKDAREVEIVQEDASQRYERFLLEHSAISSRIPQYHIASHLGITPTQLSRIRKKK